MGNGPEWRSLFEPAGTGGDGGAIAGDGGGGAGGVGRWRGQLRRRWGVALVVALMATVNPWLVSMSGEARGYTLMLLLCVVGDELFVWGAGELAVASANAARKLGRLNEDRESGRGSHFWRMCC